MIDNCEAFRPRLEEGEKLGLVELDTNGFHQPVNGKTGTKADFWCFSSHYAVHLTFYDKTTLLVYGRWNEEKAKRYARSCDSHESPKVVEVSPYWYCPAFGRVPSSKEVREIEPTIE